MEEIQKLVGDTIFNYLKENNIQFLGEPMPSDKQEEQDLSKPLPTPSSSIYLLYLLS